MWKTSGVQAECVSSGVDADDGGVFRRGLFCRLRKSLRSADWGVEGVGSGCGVRRGGLAGLSVAKEAARCLRAG